MFWGCGTLPDATQEAGSVERAAGDVTQEVHQVAGLPPQLMAAMACWGMAIIVTVWLLPNPKTLEGRGIVVGLILALLALGYLLLQGGF